MPIDAAILDVDGTVASCPYDFDDMRAAIAELAGDWGVDTGTLPTRGILEQIALIANQLAEEGSLFRECAAEIIVNKEQESAKKSTLLPGAREALKHLSSQGIGIALITRNCRAVMRQVLRGIDSYNILLARDDVPMVKPDPDHVHRALRALASAPERAIVVGDHAYDMQSGRGAGVRICLGVRSGGSSEESLWEAGADAIIESIADLPEWLIRTGELPR